MFRASDRHALTGGLRIRGTSGSLAWGHRTAATFRTWSIVQLKGVWTLTATLDRVERLYVRQSKLLFTAPRGKGQYWCWPVLDLQVNDTHTRLRAHLGLPEQ